MDLTIISTFRCNSRCQMCYIWKNPTDPKEEISLDTISKLPSGFDNLNVSGGEPTLRKDLHEIIEVVHPKARVTEISSNGQHPERLVPIIKRFPDVKVRFSLEGDEDTNNRIRGERDGYRKKTDGLRMLREAGGTDLGYAVVIQDENVEQLLPLYEKATSEGFELATSTLHNAWQFYKNDNYFYDRHSVARQVEGLIEAMLRSWNIKKWFRGYLNLGLIEKILGHERLIPCTAVKDFAFIDPWSDVWGCNVRTDLPMGNLRDQTWDEIISGEDARCSRSKVLACQQNCWMVTTARTAMRSALIPGAPKWGPAAWVIANKLRSVIGRPVPFDRYVDYGQLAESPMVERTSFLNTKHKGQLVTGRDTPLKRYPLQVFQNK